MTAHRNSIAHLRLLCTALALALLAAVPAQAKMAIQSVTSPGGITAWLVEDYSVPLVTIRFAFQGGSTQDPQGREGMAYLITGLFDEGAGDLDADAFQERLDDASAEMDFDATRDAVYGSMRMLADDREAALELLRLAINEPRFDAEPLDRIRAQVVSGIKARERDPRQLADIAWREALFGDHPYARRTRGTEVTLSAITAQDLHAFHRAVFARDNLHVGVVGAIDAESLKIVLDDLFAGLPQTAQLAPVANADPKLDQTIRIDFDRPQTSIRLAYPGVARDDPSFFAAYVMNHILGGGSFSSRLFDEVREKRGLAYGVGSYLASRDHSAALVIGTATRADRADEALSVILEEVRRMAEDGAGEAELAAAKKYIIGSYAIANLDNSSSIARALVDLQMEELGIDYIDRREVLINAVTAEQVAEQARLLLTAEPAIMLVGPAPDAGN